MELFIPGTLFDLSVGGCSETVPVTFHSCSEPRVLPLGIVGVGVHIGDSGRLDEKQRRRGGDCGDGQRRGKE